MPIEGSKPVGDWGKFIPVNDQVHLTQTNPNSYDGYGFHITTEIPGSPIKTHDRFDANGTYKGCDPTTK